MLGVERYQRALLDHLRNEAFVLSALVWRCGIQSVTELCKPKAAADHMVECEVGAGVRGRAVTDVHAARLQERQLLCDPLSCPREVLEAWEICIRHPTGAARHHHPERERQRAAARRRCEVRANNACLSALRSRARPRPRSAQRTERRPADEVPRESGEGPRPHGQRRGRGGAGVAAAAGERAIWRHCR